MATIREEFGLMDYSEEFISRIIDYRMYKDQELNRYLSYEEIAMKENCCVDDVKKVLFNTGVIWNH